MPSTIHPHVAVTDEQIAAFCRKWQITRFELFGSVLRDDFRPDSDVDVLVTFAPDAHRTLIDLGRMENELKALFGREVDLATRRSVENSRNYLRRADILGSVRQVYAATR